MGACILPWVLFAASTAHAQTTPDDEVVRPPPGTPGSTVQDEPLTPPPGTPGSTRSTAPSGTQASAAPVAPAPGSAESKPAAPPAPAEDRFYALASSRTIVRLFQRRYLSGLGDAVTDNETLVPVYEYAALRVGDVDVPWGKDALDMRLEGWGSLDTVDVSEDRRLTGDLIEANVTGKFGPSYMTLGRQVAVGGAARFTRFDGVAVGLRSSYGLGADAYAGLAVTPRFHARPEYVLLGSRADSLLKHPDALPSASLTDAWLAGGKLSWSRYERFHADLSFHEEHQLQGLARRWAALDVSGVPTERLNLGASGAFDVFAAKLADANAFADWDALDILGLSAEVTRSDPSLFLSRSSVLSVFSLDTMTEAGGEATLRVIPRVELGASAWGDWYSDSSWGSRFAARVRAGWGVRDRLVAQLRYSRVAESQMGYNAVRGSVSYRVTEPLVATAEVQQYLYDEAIRGVDSSTYGSATMEYGAAAQPWKLMVGGFMTRSPFATLDAQALARLSFDIDLATGGTKR